MKKFLTFVAILASFSFCANAQDSTNSGSQIRERKEKTGRFEDRPESINKRDGDRKERQENASPKEKEKMKARHEKWQNISPKEREKMKATRRAAWEKVSPEEKEKIKNRRKKWENTSPEEREKMKEHRQDRPEKNLGNDGDSLRNNHRGNFDNAVVGQ